MTVIEVKDRPEVQRLYTYGVRLPDGSVLWSRTSSESTVVDRTASRVELPVGLGTANLDAYSAGTSSPSYIGRMRAAYAEKLKKLGVVEVPPVEEILPIVRREITIIVGDVTNT